MSSDRYCTGKKRRRDENERGVVIGRAYTIGSLCARIGSLGDICMSIPIESGDSSTGPYGTCDWYVDLYGEDTNRSNASAGSTG